MDDPGQRVTRPNTDPTVGTLRIAYAHLVLEPFA
jgi:hypothetical protein